MTLRTKAFIALAAVALLWSSAAVVAKILTNSANPFVISFYRFALASLLFIPLFLREWKPKHYLHDLIPLGLFNAFNVIFYYSGLSLTTANAASVINTSVPITVTILSAILIGETITRHKLIGILLGLGGVLTIVFLPIFQTRHAFTGNIYGNLLIIGSVISWSLYVIRAREVVFKKGYTPILATSINFFITALVALGFSLITRQSLWVPTLGNPRYLLTLIYAVLGITIITFFLFQWAIQHISASTATMKDYLQLILGVGLNTVILGEKITLAYLAGSALVILGVFVATGHHLTRKTTASVFGQND